MRADGHVERCLGRGVERSQHALGEAGRRVDGARRTPQHARRSLDCTAGQARPSPRLVGEQTQRSGIRPWQPAVLARFCPKFRVPPHEGAQQVNTGDAVDQAVVNLRYDGEAILLQALHEPELPQRTVAFQLLRHDAPRQPLESPHIPGNRKRRVAHVVEKIEVLVVDPDGVVGDRHSAQPLAEARGPPQARLGENQDLIEIDSTVLPRQWAWLEDPHRAHVHVHAWRFQVQEGGIQRRQAVIVRVGHRLLPVTGDILPRSTPPMVGHRPRRPRQTGASPTFTN